MKYIVILEAVLFVALYYIMVEVIRKLRNRIFRRRFITGVLVAALLLSQTSIADVFVKTDAATVVAAEQDAESVIETEETVEVYNAEGRTISAFIELPDDIKVQSVPVGTALDELKLPDTLEAVCVAVDADTDTNTDVNADTDESADTDSDADEGAGTDADENTNTNIGDDVAVDEGTDTDSDADADAYTDAAVTPDDDNMLGGGTADTEGDAEEANTFSVTMPEYQTENIIEVKTLEAESLSEVPDEHSEDSKEAERSEISETSGETITIANITWHAEPEYDGDTESEYLFTAVLPEGYILTDGVNTPQITVTVGGTDNIALLSGDEIMLLADAHDHGNHQDWIPLASPADLNKFYARDGSFYLTDNIKFTSEDDYRYFEGVGNHVADICLNGHTITSSGSDRYAIYVNASSGTYDIYDCSAGTGEIIGSGSNYAIRLDAGTMNIYGGTFRSERAEAIYTYLSGKMIIHNATVTGDTKAISVNYQNVNLTIKDGTFTSNNNVDAAVYIEQGTADISGGTFRGLYGINNSGTLKLSGAPDIEGSLADIYLSRYTYYNNYTDGKITVTGPLSRTYSILLSDEITPTEENPFVFTTGDTTYNDPTKFTYKDNSYIVRKNSEGQLELAVPTYTVTYASGNASGVTGSHDPDVIGIGKSVTLPDAAFTRTGYTQTGWSTSSSGTTKNYGLNATFTPTDNITLYPYWEVNKWTVTYDYQGADGGNNSTGKQVTYGSDYGSLPDPSRTGYTFEGWYTEANGSGSLVESTTTVTTDEDHTLYAHWTGNQYDVTLKYQDDKTADQKITVTYGSKYGSDLSTEPTRAGYSFVGWFTAAEGGDEVNSDSKVATAQDHTLYAQWVDNIKPTIEELTYNYVPKTVDGWIIGNKQLVITVPVKEEGSGVSEITYTITPENGTPSTATAQLTATANTAIKETTITVNADFKGTIKIDCQDAAGNQADSKTVGTSGGVIVEDDAPTVSFEIGGSAVSGEAGYYDEAPDVNVTVTDNTDNAISGGIASVAYQIDNGSAQSVTEDFTTTIKEQCSFTIPASEIPTGVNDITVKVEDNAGNTGDATLTVKVKGPEKTPDAKLDEVHVTITDLVPGAEYDITYKDAGGNPHTDKVEADGNGNLDIKDDWTGGEVEIVKKGNGTETSDSQPQELEIPEREPAPEGLTKADESLKGANDGKIGGLVPGETYEVSNDGGKTWEKKTADDKGEIEPLAPGGYEVRRPAGDDTLPSKPTHVDIKESDITQEKTPEASVDRQDGKIKGLVPGAKYDITYTDKNGKPHTDTVTADENGNLEIEDDWTGGNIDIVKKGSGDNNIDSPPQSLAIPEREPAPSDAKMSKKAGKDGQGGSIGGLTPGETYQISKDGGKTWEDVTADEDGEIKPVDAGSYDIRKKAGDNTLPSKPVHVEVTKEKGGSPGGSSGGGGGKGNDDSDSGSGDSDNGGDPDNGSSGGGDDSGNGNGGQPSGGDDNGSGTGSDTGTPGGTQPGTGDTAGTGGTGNTGNTGGTGGTGGTGSTDGTGNTDRDKEDRITGGGGDSDDSGSGSSPDGDNGSPSSDGTDVQPSDGTGHTVQAELEDGKIVISGDDSGTNGTSADNTGTNGNATGAAIATGTIGTAQSSTTTLTVGEGAVTVTVDSDGYRGVAGVADTVAVANAVLTPEQKQRVNDGEKIVIRVEVKDISGQVSQQDKETIESGLTDNKITGDIDGQEQGELTLGAYIDISMYIRVGDGDWDAVTQSDEPIEIVIGIPDDLLSEGRTYYIARSHEGTFALLDDLDSEADTITIRTELFSTYAIVFRQMLGTGADADASSGFLASLSWTAVALWGLGILVMLGIAVFLIFWKRRKDGGAAS